MNKKSTSKNKKTCHLKILPKSIYGNFNEVCSWQKDNLAKRNGKEAIYVVSVIVMKLFNMFFLTATYHAKTEKY